MIVLVGGDLVLPDRVLSRASLLLDAARIAAVEPTTRAVSAGAIPVDVSDCYVVPGFVDVHVHGVDGVDSLDGDAAVTRIASSLPRYGVTAFCPTTVACSPSDLETVLGEVGRTRLARPYRGARVLPAHLESNFINPDYRGAQPAACLRLPPLGKADSSLADTDYAGAHILAAIARCRSDVGVVTLAPELPGAIDLIQDLVSFGIRVSLGHSGATFEETLEAIGAGATRATHLFNRMTPMTHRAPGLPGAVLAREEITAELICDGYHVHPAMCQMAIRSKGVGGIMAITDGSAGAGLRPGTRARLGGRQIRVTDHAAVLDDGTLAGSTLTMDRAFRNIVSGIGLSVVDATRLCSTNPARELGLAGLGVIVEGATADLVVLDRRYRVVRTFIDGEEVYRSGVTA